MRHDVMSAICALFILAWCVFVCSALLLSSVGQLGNRGAYITISLILAIIFTRVIWRMRINATICSLPTINYQKDENYLIKWGVRGIAWLAIFSVIVSTILLCLFYTSNNYDSIAYRFPRAMFYIDQGTLSQIPGDFRIQFYPFNVSLVYIWFAIHNLAGAWFNLFGLISWLVGGIAVWRIARDIGAGQTSALIASAIFISCPAVLVSASSTNDDLISGVPLLIGIMFLNRWWKSGSWSDVMLAAIGLGLTLGSKLHWVMMLPIAAILLALVIYRLKCQGILSSFLQPRVKQISIAVCVILTLTLPVFVINWSESGQFIPSVPGLQNSPFSIISASVHSLVSTASMLLGPVPDLYLSHSQATRQAFGDAFNNWINNHLLFWITPELDYVAEHFIFPGVVSNAAHLGVGEVSVWLGLVPWLLGLVILLLLRKRNNQFQQIVFWLALTFFGWHFARCFMLKWVPGEGIYYAFIIALAAPAIAYLWEYNNPGERIKEILIKGICITVLFTNLVSAVNYFMFNPQRNLHTLFASHFNPEQRLISPQLSQVLRSSQRTMIVYNQWELPYFTFMNENPNARYATSLELSASPPPNFDLALVLVGNAIIPMQFVNDDRPRLSFLGHYGLYGWSSVFGNGPIINKLARQNTERAILSPKFALLEIAEERRNENGGLTSFKLSMLHGISSDEEFLVSVTLVTPAMGITRILENEPFPRMLPINLFSAPSEGYMLIQAIRRDKPNIIGHAWLPLDPKQDSPNVNKRGLINYNADEPSGSYGFANEPSGSYGFISGWLLENTNSFRWMSGATSEIVFPTLYNFNACSLDFEMISRVKGDIYIYLNGEILHKIKLNNPLVAQRYQLKLPDNSTSASINRLKFSIESKNRNIAVLGLDSFSIDCAEFGGSRIY